MAPDDSSVEKYAIDATDIKLLRALQTNARLTVKELAARVNLSTTPCLSVYSAWSATA